ncbi:glycosyl transferase possibly involved in lipopolysaccharide synthesis [Aequorivita sublithincola DSM 14238]|uniref:Glycosyl transferase possibly involved in lipopolysaccharide synthesis n=1 Tax=Aequorivita sublithincola (strain DSM 14238 / LMG 21431 / ACAM 643 / 9-3) TaxID=746697 RepID=I3YZD1_AEQSU|nr:sugar transferase [Aequorivita sublithincola]AFL82349.1 glycosyl transferase possibly involved in lipopolysaccharide synthesis [Aequorivita sublithincola DSM 14238]
MNNPIKRTFDLLLSTIGLLTVGWVILPLAFFAFIDTGKGIFVQTRVGQFGKHFRVYKICSMESCCGAISGYGRFLRLSKLDELPQLFNILMGQMSFVGPRPDVPGYYDMLRGEDRKLLELKPGLCSRAALKYFNEEALLAKKAEPMKYNDEVIFPEKVRMNLEYYQNRSFWGDIEILIESFLRGTQIMRIDAD